MKGVLLAASFSLLISLFGTPLFIKFLVKRGYGQFIRDDGPTSHHTKRGTPTMGGAVILAATLGAYFLAHLFTLNPPTASGLLVLFLMAGLGFVGFLDDFIKISKQRSLGLRSREKLIGQTLVGVIFAGLALQFPNEQYRTPASLLVSFVRDTNISLALGGSTVVGVILFVIFANVMIAGASNGVNLTDGLDGLATGVCTMVFGADAYPDGRLTSPLERVGLVVAYGATVLLLGLAPALVFDPAAQGCSQCPANLLARHQRPRSPRRPLQRDGVRARPGLGARACRPRRVARRAVVFRGAAPHGARAARGASCTSGSSPPTTPTASAADSSPTMRSTSGSGAGQAAALGALALGVVLAWVRGRRARDERGAPRDRAWRGARAGRASRRARPRPRGSGARARLPARRGPPGRRRRAAPSSCRRANGRAVTPLVRGGRPVAVLGHRADLLDDPGLLEEVGAAARLALDHERLQAEPRAQLEQLRASRARDRRGRRRRAPPARARPARRRPAAARRALAGAAAAARPARRRRQPGASTRQRPSCAARSTSCASSARGIYPAVLVDEGLAAALDALAEEGRVPIVVGPMPARAARSAGRGRRVLPRRGGRQAQPRTWRRGLAPSVSDGRLVVEIDAAGTLDGRPHRSRGPHRRARRRAHRRARQQRRTTIRAEVPCAS